MPATHFRIDVENSVGKPSGHKVRLSHKYQKWAGQDLNLRPWD